MTPTTTPARRLAGSYLRALATTVTSTTVIAIVAHPSLALVGQLGVAVGAAAIAPIAKFLTDTADTIDPQG